MSTTTGHVVEIYAGTIRAHADLLLDLHAADPSAFDNSALFDNLADLDYKMTALVEAIRVKLTGTDEAEGHPMCDAQALRGYILGRKLIRAARETAAALISSSAPPFEVIGELIGQMECLDTDESGVGR